METFGRVEDQNRLRTILEDAAGKSRKLGKPIFIGCDAEGNAAMSPDRDLHSNRIKDPEKSDHIQLAKPEH